MIAIGRSKKRKGDYEIEVRLSSLMLIQNNCIFFPSYDESWLSFSICAY